MTTPPLPPGFELEQPQMSATPPLPPGFELMSDMPITDPLPSGPGPIPVTDPPPSYH